MPSSPNILKEFLIAIGFKVDEQQFRSFQNRFRATIGQFEELGKVAAASSLAISAAVIKVASDMERLYFSAQRAGTSVGGLRAVRFAAEQIGIGADAAAGQIEGMASALRSNPGLMVFFKQLGLKDVGDNTKNFVNLIAKLTQMSQSGGHVLATQIAGQFGIDERTLTQYEKNLPEFLRSMKQFQDEASKRGGTDDAQAKAFHQFMDDVRSLETSITNLANLFGTSVLPYADDIAKKMKEAVDWAIELDKRTGGKSTLVGGVAGTAASVWGIGKTLKWFTGMFGGGAAAGGVAAGTEGGLSLDGPIGMGLAGILALSLAKKNKNGGAGTDPMSLALLLGTNPKIVALIEKVEGFSRKVYNDIAGHPTVGYGHKLLPGESFPQGVTNKEAERLLGTDLQSAMATVFRLVKVKLNENQVQALTDLVYNIGGEKFWGSTLLKKLNSGDYAGASDEFAKWNKAVVNGQMITSDDLTARRLGDRNLFNTPDVKIDQQTTIHISGTGDPQAAGKEVGKQQDRVNGDLLRNMQGAMP